jgi:hypothetical protein
VGRVASGTVVTRAIVTRAVRPGPIAAVPRPIATRASLALTTVPTSIVGRPVSHG